MLKTENKNIRKILVTTFIITKKKMNGKGVTIIINMTPKNKHQNWVIVALDTMFHTFEICIFNIQ